MSKPILIIGRRRYIWQWTSLAAHPANDHWQRVASAPANDRGQ